MAIVKVQEVKKEEEKINPLAVKETAKVQAAMIIDNKLIDGLSTVLNEKMELGMTFPADYNPTNALTGAYLSLKQQTDKNGKPMIESCSQASVSNAIMDMVMTGLDVTKAQGYFIAYGQKLSFQKSYFGWQTMARRCGVKTIDSMCIFEGDKFDYEVENGRITSVSHKQSFDNIKKEKIIGVYAVLSMNNGQKYIELMTFDEVKDSWRMNKSNHGTGDTHKNFTVKMSQKTVITRACKSIVNIFGNDDYVYSVISEEEMENANPVIENTKNDIAENANSQDFEDFDVMDIPECDIIIEDAVKVTGVPEEFE